MQLHAGDVYEPGEPDKRPIRVLMADDIEAHYDTWWPEGGWDLSRTWRKNFAFYRGSVRWIASGRRLRTEPLSTKEQERYRLDLPLRLCRHPSLNWAQLDCASPAHLSAAAAAHDVDISVWPGLRARAVALMWYPRMGAKGAVTQVAGGPDGIVPVADMLWHAQKLVNAQRVADGVGLFRSGLSHGVPSYYIRGYHDMAGCTWRHEHVSEQIAPSEWQITLKPAAGSYRERLLAIKRQFPFKDWRSREERGSEQYTNENCAAMAAVFDKLLKRLIAMGESASEAEKLAAFEEAIEATNELNAEEMNLIETGEREQLCDLCNEIARAAGLDPTKYGGGEGPASEWRDW